MPSINCRRFRNRVFIVLIYYSLFLSVFLPPFPSLSHGYCCLFVYLYIYIYIQRRKPFNNLFLPNRFPYFLLLLRLCPNFWPQFEAHTSYAHLPIGGNPTCGYNIGTQPNLYARTYTTVVNPVHNLQHTNDGKCEQYTHVSAIKTVFGKHRSQTVRARRAYHCIQIYTVE